jgi:hypothetical protein
VTDWRYFTETDDVGPIENGWGVALMRLEIGDPWRLAEVLRKPGSWVQTDRLERRYLRGSFEGELMEIDAYRAHELMQFWLASERLDALPIHMPLDDGPEPSRGVDAEEARGRLRVRARQVEADAVRRYAGVPVPDGAASISIDDI